MKVCRFTRFAVSAGPLAAILFLSPAVAQQPGVGDAPRDPVLSTGPVIVESNSGQEAEIRPVDPAAPESIDQPFRMPMFDDAGQASPSDYRRSKPTAAEIRQARALYRDRQRVARMEYNLWRGHEPLRPQFNSIPMMTSRYAPRRVIYVPVYIPAR